MLNFHVFIVLWEVKLFRREAPESWIMGSILRHEFFTLFDFKNHNFSC